jgi:hypothetical protein
MEKSILNLLGILRGSKEKKLKQIKLEILFFLISKFTKMTVMKRMWY